MASTAVLTLITLSFIHWQTSATNYKDLVIEEKTNVTFACSCPPPLTTLFWMYQRDRNIGTCRNGLCNVASLGPHVVVTQFIENTTICMLRVNFTRLPYVFNTSSFLISCTYEETDPLNVWTIYLYAKPTSVQCNSPIISNRSEVSIMCSSENVYPAALCNITLTKNNAVSSSLVANVKEFPSAQTIPYYTTRCSVEINITDVGFHMFEATFYHASSALTYKWIAVKNITITLPTPILKQCPNTTSEYIKAGDVVSCTCSSNVSSNFGLLKWLDTSNQINEEVDAILILKTSSSGQPSKDFVCQAISPPNSYVTGGNIQFKPKIAYGPDSDSVILTYQDEDICDASPFVLHVNCSVLINSAKPGVTFSFFMNSSNQININDISNDYFYRNAFKITLLNGGIYYITCAAKNLIYHDINGTTAGIVKIRKSPGPPQLMINNGQPVEEGVIVDITCNTDFGYPPPNFTVSCASNTIHNGYETQFRYNFSRTMNNETCICKANHELKCYTNNTATVVMNVTYPASITAFTANKTAYNLTVLNGSAVEFMCTGDSNPAAKYDIVKNDVKIINGYATNLDCDGSGEYTCFAYNGFGRASNKTLKVFVMCTFQLKKTYDTFQSISAVLGGSVSFQIGVYGYPSPTGVLINKTTTSGENIVVFIPMNESGSSPYKICYSPTSEFDGLLNISVVNLTSKDFSTYILSVENNMGLGLQYRFEIKAEGCLSCGPNRLAAAIGGGLATALIAVGIVFAVVFCLKTRVKCHTTNKLDKYMDNIHSKEQDTQNNDLYFIKLKDNSELCLNYKSYSDISTTITSATAAPKNLKSKSKPVPKPTYFNTVESYSDDYLIQGQEKHNLIIKGNETKDAEVYTNDTDPEKKTNDVYANC